MTYKMPEIVDLGAANKLIQNAGHKDEPETPDGSNQPSCGDYEADE